MRAAFAKTILVVDEGSLASTVQARDLLRIASELRIPRVVLVGDAKQLDAVDAGKPLLGIGEMGLLRSILLVFGQWGLDLGFSLAGLEERARCGLALAGRLGSTKIRGVNSSRHRRLNVQTSTSHARSPFRRKTVSLFGPTDFGASRKGRLRG